jgi:thiosulfate/3-mercaptopyruvate sulfurtransferase
MNLVSRIVRLFAFTLGAFFCVWTGRNLLHAEIKLISPSDAMALINHPSEAERVVVLDTRGSYQDYFRGHLPRAHHINFDSLRGTDHGVPVQFLPDELTRSLLVRAGVHRDKTHIIYASGASLPNDEILSSSMVAYVLEKFGIDDIRIVDGGLAEWSRAKLPVTQEYFGNPTGLLPKKAKNELAISIEEIIKTKDQADVMLVDARSKDEYLGKDQIWLRKGHIPGAVSFHWARLMESSNTHRFLPEQKCLEELAAAGITKDKKIIVYCGTSREACLVRFYLKHVIGYPDVLLYEGSWKEYVALKHYPAEVKESVRPQ